MARLTKGSARLLEVGLLFLVVGLWACPGEGPEEVSVSFVEPASARTLAGSVRVEVAARPQARITRVAINVRDSAGSIKEVGARTRPPYVLYWNTLPLADGPYMLDVVVSTTEGKAVRHEVGPLVVANGAPVLEFVDCTDSMPVRDRFSVTLELKAPGAAVPKGVELFVDGKPLARRASAPFTFEIDLGARAAGEEVFLSAVAVNTLQKGATALCAVRVDRNAPTLAFVYPAKEGQTVPIKFDAVLKVLDTYGIKEVTVTAGGRVAGKATTPPYRVKVDLSGRADRSRVLITAWATDLAGNRNLPAVERIGVLDASPPKVRVVSPGEGSVHRAKVRFAAEVSDENAVDRVDFYILDEKGQRLDNILHSTGAKNGSNSYSVEVDGVVSLYGFGKRTLLVVATDVHANRTEVRRGFGLGCKAASDCPASTPAYWCLNYRCVVPGRVGEPCSGEQVCENGLVCFPGGLSYCDPQRLGVCRRPCKTAIDQCSKGEFCLSAGALGRVCFRGDPCGPFSSNCAASSQCVPWDQDSFVCLPTGPGREGASCSPYGCLSGSACAKGHACVPIRGGGICRKLCETLFPQRDCGQGQRCVHWPLRDSRQNNVGYCLRS